MSTQSVNFRQIEIKDTPATQPVRRVFKSLTALAALFVVSGSLLTSTASAANVTRLKLNVEETDNNKCFELEKKSHYTGQHTFFKGRGYQVLEYNHQIRCLKLDPQLPFQTEAVKSNPNLCLCYGTLSVNTSS